MVSARSLLKFRTLRANLRSVLFCALLLLGHVIITTLSALVHSFESSADIQVLLATLPRMTIPRLSGLIFITLLWQGFILFELADTRVADQSVTLSPEEQNEKAVLVNEPTGSVKEEEEEGLVLFTSTVMEFVVGVVVAGLWTAAIPSLQHLCNVFSSQLARDLLILRPLLIIAYTCTILLNLQIPLEIARRAARRDLTGRWWTAAVGEWAGRIQLEEKA